LKKKELRTKALAKRKALSKIEYWELNQKILERIKQFDWSGLHYVHLFLPISEQNEVDNFELILYLKTQYPDLKIVLPKTDFLNSRLQHILYEHQNTILIKNKYQIPEPHSGENISVKLIDAVIVPLLAFDLQGNRIGYGGGYYDRFLSQCNANILKIGLSFFPPESEPIAAESFDIKLSHCITPEKTYVF
jgi:5-formyltetrahydrofolate cyclo-ligase